MFITSIHFSFPSNEVYCSVFDTFGDESGQGTDFTFSTGKVRNQLDILTIDKIHRLVVATLEYKQQNGLLPGFLMIITTQNRDLYYHYSNQANVKKPLKTLGWRYEFDTIHSSEI